VEGLHSGQLPVAARLKSLRVGTNELSLEQIRKGWVGLGKWWPNDEQNLIGDD